MKKIICYGDSNTYGYDARLGGGGRFPESVRWTGILSQTGEYEIINQGENGREIPHDRWELESFDKMIEQEAPFDLLTVMLGTNDICMMYRSGMDKIALRMQEFLEHILKLPAIAGEAGKVLLIAPTKTGMSIYGSDGERLDKISEEFAPAYRALAEKLGVRFTDAGEWGINLCLDGAHFTPSGHTVFAQHMMEVLKNCGL